MPRTQHAARLSLRTWILPALQSLLTGGSTGLAVILVAVWRPQRPRFVPFYSDATHNDPERIILAIGENLACFLMPLVAVAEYLQQSRLAVEVPRVAVPRFLRYIPASYRASTSTIVQANFFVTAMTTMFFFVTANVPSKYPYTPPHQFAASALILMYALQATLKAILAKTFSNYEVANDGAEAETSDIDGKAFSDGGGSEDEGSFLGQLEAGNRKGSLSGSGGGNCLGSWWGRHHMKIRIGLAIVLWTSLVTTWLCFMGRVVTRRWAGWGGFRRWLSLCMAVIVHAATGSCVTLMGVMAVDMRGERVTIESRR